MKHFLLAILLFSGLLIQGQPVRTCGTMDYFDQLMMENPNEAKQIIQLLNKQTLSATQRSNGKVVITIPVVVHVVYNNAQQNISYNQILSQIQVLNEDFRRLNADTTNTPAIFQTVAADAEIEFCLAVQDPNGNYTTGVTRTATSVGSFSTGNRIKTTAQGGKDAWPTDKYLNIWVGNLGQSLLGYATFPGGNPTFDGIVVNYRYFGRYGSAQVPFHLGRTATHEVGHWLGLRHIWGDGGCGVDDNISDTPISDAANYNCPQNHTSCGSLDMVQNYMDYTDDGCMNIFTLGQKNKMRDILNITRVSLTTSTACELPQLPPFILINASDTTICAGEQVQFFDQSLNNPFRWKWIFEGGTANNDTVQNPLVTYDSAGIFSVTLIAENIYGIDTVLFKNFIKVEGANVNLPIYTGFENELMPPLKWNIKNPDGDRTFKLSNAAGGFGNSSNSALYESFSMSLLNRIDLLATPKVDFSNVVDPYIAFDIAYTYKDSNKSDTLILLYSTDCGETYIRFFSKSGSSLITAPQDSAYFIPTPAQWRRDSISLKFLEGNKVVKLAIGIISGGGGNNLYIDNIMIAQPATAPPVADFKLTANAFCSGSDIIFIDSSQNNVKEWFWQFPGGTPATSSEQNPVVIYNNPGSYSVQLKVKNSFGTDSIIKNQIITINPAPQVTVQSTDVLCNGSFTGIAKVNIISGTAPLFVKWVTGQNTTIVNGLPAGSYSVTVTDSNQCKVIDTAIINQPPPILATVVAQAATIDSSNGSATVSVTGGVPPYTFLWSDNQNTATATGLASGNYDVTIIDANNCVRVLPVFIPVTIPSSIHIKSSTSISVYPNPTSGVINLEITLENPASIEYDIFNSLGQPISKKVLGTRTSINENIDLTDSPAGIYLLKVKAGEEFKYFKVIKN